MSRNDIHAMKDLLSAVMAQAMTDATMEGVDLQMDVSSVLLTVTLSNFDAVEPFAIPEATLNAPEA